MPDGVPTNPRGFGQALALDGDTLVVGAGSDETRGYGAGSVYLFARTNGAWSPSAQLFASDAGEDDGFGGAVSVRGDVLIVGAPRDDTPAGETAGSAYVFRRVSGAWQEEATLVASAAAGGDHVGNAVAVDGDFAVVTSVGATQRAGLAYAFLRDPSSGEWSRQVPIVPLPVGDTRVFQFGSDVSLQGSTVVVGSMNDIRMSMPNVGSAYVYLLQGGEVVP